MLDRPAFYVWSLTGPVLTGALITAVLVIPQLASHLGTAMLACVAIGLVAAIPLSLVVEKKLR